MKTFKEYMEDMLTVIIITVAFGTLSLFTMEDASTFWRVVVPVVFFGITIGTTLYGYLKYKK